MARNWRFLRLGVGCGDVLAVCFAYWASRDMWQSWAMRDPVFGMRSVYPLLVAGVVILVLGAAWSESLYSRWALLGGHRVYPGLLKAATVGLVGVIVLGLLGGPRLVARTWLVASWLLTVVLLSLGRLLWRQVALGWQRRGYLVRRVLIVGANQHGIVLAQQLDNPAAHGRKVVGFLDDYERPGTEVLPGLTILGHPSSLLEVAGEIGAEEVILIAGALTWESQRQVAELVTRPGFPLDARLSPSFDDLLTTSAELSHIGYVPMLTLSAARLRGLNAPAKRLIDVAIASCVLVLSLPIGLYLKLRALRSGVRLLVRERALGYGGRQIGILGINPQLVRSPVLGRFPALWNVLCHDLSLVGPRPIRSAEAKDHERWLSNLHGMRPGLTGLWRLRPGDWPVEERVGLDLFYIRNYSLSLDAQLLVNTVRLLGRRLLLGEDALARWGPESDLGGPHESSLGASEGPRSHEVIGATTVPLETVSVPRESP